MKNDLDFSKILDSDNKIIGALNLNNMIPVSKEVIRILDIRPDRRDSPKERAYKELLNNQLDWCNNNIESITKKANKLYVLVTQTPEKSRNLTKRCCDFKKLEAVLEKKLLSHQEQHEQPSKPSSFTFSSKQRKQVQSAVQQKESDKPHTQDKKRKPTL